MRTTVKKTKSGKGAMVIVHESPTIRRLRRNRRKARVEAARMNLTEGQAVSLVRKRASG
jgi:hypothetical protein